jgi:adenine-specific DNA-methyltransferase
VYYPVKGRHWGVREEEYLRLLEDKRIIFGKNGKGKPSKKRFLVDALEKGSTPKSIWDDVGTTTNGTQELEEILGEKKFSNPKPVSLLKRIIQLATDKNSIVLDFMAGSRTTVACCAIFSASA